mgnify:CR=1 FL=1
MNTKHANVKLARLLGIAEHAITHKVAIDIDLCFVLCIWFFWEQVLRLEVNNRTLVWINIIWLTCNAYRYSINIHPTLDTPLHNHMWGRIRVCFKHCMNECSSKFVVAAFNWLI